MIEFIDVNIAYDNQPILSKLTFHIGQGEKVLLKGKSGSGKSSIIKAILAFKTPESGIIRIKDTLVNGENGKNVRNLTSWVPQDIWSPHETVEDFFIYPFTFKSNVASKPSEAQIKSILENFMLPYSIMKKPLKKISGGEKQRIALCSSLLLKKEIILWDEPTSALDDHTKEIICHYIKKQTSLTLIISSHDAQWETVADQVIKTEDYHVA